MAEYRDDRAGLKQRLAEMEAELARERARTDTLEQAADRARQLEAEKDKLAKRLARYEPEAAARRRHLLLGVLAAAVAMLFMGGTVAFLTVSGSDDAPPPTVATAAVPAPKPVAAPAKKPWTPEYALSPTCRCEKTDTTPAVALGSTAGATISMGATTTYSVLAVLRMSGPDGDQDRRLAVGPQTVPPARVEGGKLGLLSACAADRLILAHGQRVSAWSLHDATPAWQATLPAPVGSAENGALGFECTPLTVDPRGVVTIPTAAGAVKLDAATGAAVK